MRQGYVNLCKKVEILHGYIKFCLMTDGMKDEFEDTRLIFHCIILSMDDIKNMQLVVRVYHLRKSSSVIIDLPLR